MRGPLARGLLKVPEIVDTVHHVRGLLWRSNVFSETAAGEMTGPCPQGLATKGDSRGLLSPGALALPGSPVSCHVLLYHAMLYSTLLTALYSISLYRSGVYGI